MIGSLCVIIKFTLLFFHLLQMWSCWDSFSYMNRRARLTCTSIGHSYGAKQPFLIIPYQRRWIYRYGNNPKWKQFWKISIPIRSWNLHWIFLWICHFEYVFSFFIGPIFKKFKAIIAPPAYPFVVFSHKMLSNDSLAMHCDVMIYKMTVLRLVYAMTSG